MDSNKVEKLFIPELQVLKVVTGIVEAIREDHDDASDKKDTFLYKALQDLKADNYEFYTQSVEMFCSRKKNDSRRLEVRLFFDARRAELPTIHINLPQENRGEDGMGSDEGFQPTIFNDPKLEFVRQFNRRFNANYQVLFSSNNSLEVILLYHVIRAGFIANLGGLEVLGLTNLSLSGGDLQLHPDVVPQGVFVRGFNLNFGYEVTAPAINKEKFYTKIFLKQPTLIIKND